MHGQLDLPALKACHQQFEKAVYQGVPGVICIDSGQPGPTLGLAGMTHGNEPVGLGLFEWYLRTNWLGHNLQRGKVVLALLNLNASRKYLWASDDDDLYAFRAIDRDMNRLPLSDEEFWHSNQDEVQRVRELLPVFQDWTHALDLHSTSKASEPMIIQIQEPRYPFPPDLFPDIPIVVRNVSAYLQGAAVVSKMCQTPASPCYVVECGPHESPSAIDMARNCALSLMRKLDMVEAPLREISTSRTIYDVCQSVAFPNPSYRLKRLLDSFEQLPEGLILAEGDGEPIRVKEDSYAIMPPAEHPRFSEYDFMFLGTPCQS